jgi:glycosyltransferase involved in cell wall biosynthesis
MENLTPFFSIIIPTFNREKHILDAINSILKQNFEDFEVLVIDNQSKDNTKNIVQSIGDNRVFFYQNEKNYERCFSRNRGVFLAKGLYILFLDSDDLFESNHLMNWYQFIKNKCCNLESFYVSDKKILNETEKVHKKPILSTSLNPVAYFFLNPIVPGQVCVPSHIMKKYKFRDDLLIFEDSALWMELAYDYSVSFNNLTSFIYRLHKDNSVNELANNAYFNRLTAIRILLKEKRINHLLSNQNIRFSLNSCYMGIIRYHNVNSPRIIRFIWVLKSLIFFPEFGFKNKILLLFNTFPLISSLSYFRVRKL